MGKEWSNHKYVDKVKTKSGKTRYVYDSNESKITPMDRYRLQQQYKIKKDLDSGNRELKELVRTRGGGNPKSYLDSAKTKYDNTANDVKNYVEFESKVALSDVRKWAKQHL